MAKKVRYAVVGLGNISQQALIPGFKNARNCEVTALVSGEAKKRDKVAKEYGIKRTYSYDQYDECLKSGEVDAVYIGLPNHMHCDYTVRTAEAGIHVLCEKPMAVDEAECERMIRACETSGVKLMIAYRLHFEEGNLEAIRLAASKKLGDLRLFSSSFSQQVRDENVRTAHPEAQGGGSVYDMGVYCINAVRGLFQAEPIEVIATDASANDPRFERTPEMTSVILRFPGERLATITSSFGAKFYSEFTLLGTKGVLRLSPSYVFNQPIRSQVWIDAKEESQRYKVTDQFGGELEYFSNCILKNREPEPNGIEGLADVRVVRAILESAKTKAPVKLDEFKWNVMRPKPNQVMKKAPVKAKKLIDAPPPAK